MTDAEFERRLDACYAITLVVRLLAEKSGCQIPIPAQPDLGRASENLFCTYLGIHAVIVFSITA